MRKTLAVTLVLSALPAAASQSVTPALLPKLIGSSAVVIEQAFGKPVRDCTAGRRPSGKPMLRCGYQVDGKQLGIVYEGGVATEAMWHLGTKEGRLTQADLGFGKDCDGPKRQWNSGGEVWSRCPGGLSVEIQNDEKGGTFLIHVASRELLLP